MALICASCGTANLPTVRHCSVCGLRLIRSTEGTATRRAGSFIISHDADGSVYTGAVAATLCLLWRGKRHVLSCRRNRSRRNAGDSADMG